MAEDLNTTEFAILGLLSRRPWSAYELTQYMRVSNVRAIWPRAESRLYEAPKKLARLGYASTTSEKQGKRSRTVYHITQKGREALTTWLEQDSRPFLFEYESLLKLALGDIGDEHHRRTQLASLQRESQADWATMAEFFRHFARGEFEQNDGDRLVQNLLVNSFIKELLDARLRWSQFAADIDSAYAQCSSEEEKAALVQRFYRKMMGGMPAQGEG